MRAGRLTSLIRDYFAGEKGRFVFEPQRDIHLPRISRADLYLHIPFCRHLCPYCPYNRILYERSMAERYLAAVLTEIDAWHRRFGRIEIGSVYIGGGTPTTMLDELGQVLQRIRQRFSLTGSVAIETTPVDLDRERLCKLRDIGTDLLSVGVQSFDDRYLKLIGRDYRSGLVAPAIERALSTGFDAVNLDLMFALPGQTTGEAWCDLRRAIALGPDQITLYPLFTFPYSAVGRHMRLRRVRFPNLRARRQMYRALHEDALAHGLWCSSVWSFKRGEVESFSSVTRSHYIGIGAGAGTCLPGLFSFNTFSVPDYALSLEEGHSPIALKMDTTPAIERLYWLYWRLYDSRVPRRELDRLFTGDTKISHLLWLADKLRLLNTTDDAYVLTERGSFWIHLLQNYYILNYINTVWTRAMQRAWPGRIEL